MSSQNFSTFTEVGMIDARSQNGVITLPLSTDIPYRILTLKDIYGASAASSITLTTQGSDVFEDGTTSRLLNGAFETTTLYAGQPGFWYTTGGSRLATAVVGSLSTGLITNPLRLGTLSTQTSIQFPGVNTSYKGTVIAGQTTGAGTQELLLYQASTVSDQIRLQTTGNIVFEAGAAVRSFPSTQMLATPTLYIAGTTSNVGIGTAAPAATLDVAGQGRFQTVSTLALNVSSINGAVPWQQSFLTSSVQGLGSAGYVSTSQLTSTMSGLGSAGYVSTSQLASTMSGLGSAGYISSTQLYSTVSGLVIVAASAFTGSTTSLSSGSITTNALQAYSYINMTGGVFSNVATSFFTTPKYTTTFTPTSISGLRVWFDASLTTSILSNGSGQVYQWNNLAPGFPNAVQATTANQPYTGLSNYNGLNTMSFINTNTSILNIASISYSNSYRSFFVVYQFPGTYTTGALSITDGVTIFNAPDYPSFKFGHTATPGFYNGYTIPSSSYRAGFGVLTGSLNSSLGSPFYYNGSNNAIVSGASSLFTSASYTGTIGGGNPVNICEYIGYDSELTSSQRLIVEGYLAWKWGFQSSLISTHPYYTVAPPPLGIVYLPAGSVGTDATSNLAIQATANTKISIAGNTQITGVLTTSSIGVSSITGTYASLSSLQVSSINGAVPWQQSFLTSTTQGLGLIGYISSTQLTSTVAGLNIVAANAFTGSTTLLSAGTINVSTLNSVYLSSVQGYVSSLRTDSLTVGGPTGYVTVQDLTTGTVSTGQLVAGAGFISSLQINSLSFGPTGYVIVGNFIASSLSTMKLNTQNLYTNNAYIGNVSSQSAILFPGVDGNFRGTAVAEQGTGPGTGELLLYKVSTTTDQIRLQTTGNIVFEAGASARSWPSTQTLATPTLYIQGTTSNIGVGTATPATTLDVVGTVRGQVLSTLTLNTSTINGIVPGAAFNGSTLALSTGSITTNALQAYSYINMTGGAFSNVATSFFTTPKFTTTFSPTSISGLKVWLDASKITSITSNGSGQVLSLSNLTGLGNATQGTPSSAPLTGQYTFNNLNVLSNSFNTQLVLPSINYTSQYRTAFLVLQAPHYSAWIGANRSTDSIGMWSYGDLEIETAGTWIALTSFPSNAQNIPIIIDIHSSAASNGVYMNGSNLGSLLRTFATGSFTDTIGLGGTGTPLGGYYGASWYFGEFIYYDADLTVSQRQTVEGYLAWKWGTQGLLAPTHPSYSAPPPPLGTVYLAAGSVGTDATSNISIQATATTKISLAGNTQITGVLTTSSIGVSSITGRFASLSSVQISSINGLAVPTAFVGSTNFISASLVQAPLLSTFALNVSSINGAAPWQQSFLTSTTQGLGTLGYISSASLQSTVQGLGTTGYISSASLQSTVQGLGTTGYISSASLQSTFRGLGTAGYISSSQLTSTLAGLGTFGYISTQSLQSTVAGLNIVATNAFTGSTTSLSAGTIFVSSLNANTINVSTIYITDTSLTSTSGSITQQNQILYFNTMPFAGTQAWFGQMIIPPGPPLISVFSYTGASQTWTVPTNVNSVNAYMWGAGGGGGGTIVGGAGAFVQAAVPVTPGETLTLIVGGGGARNSASAFGGGGVGGGGGFGTGGGGRTAIQRGSNDYVAVGAGGGSTSYGTAGIGGAGGILTGSPAVGTTGLEGQGGTQSAGGAGTSGVLSAGTSGSAGAGGTAGGYGGGGGSGYYGGGGSGATTAVGASGGGGSSLVNNSVPILLVVSSDGTSAPNTASQYYVSPVAAGGTNAASGNGGNGLIVLSYTAAPPAAASGLTLTLNGSTATLSWNSAGVPLYYWAFYGNSTSAYTGTYLMSGSTAGTSVSYSVTATFFDYFRLVSLSPLGCISAIVSSPIVQVPAPTGLTITAFGTAVTMSWTAVSGATGYAYTLYSNTGYAYGGSSVATGSVGTNTATYSSGVVGTYYYFTVSATTGYGTSLLATSGIVQDTALPASITASGGISTSPSGYSVYRFNTTGTASFTLTSPSAALAQILVIGGGGGGGSGSGGGGGGGGLVYLSNVSISAGTYSLNVGGGGAGSASTPGYGQSGSNSYITFGGTTYTGIGGGAGGGNNSTGASGSVSGGYSGGCGGGGGGQAISTSLGAAGTQPYLSAQSPAGTSGANSPGGALGGGGGGMGAAASGATGGAGLSYTIVDGVTAVYYSGGGGGGGYLQNGTGGTGGGGTGGGDNYVVGGAGTPNRGGGGGGGGSGGGVGGAGGSGTVIIAFQVGTPPPTNLALTPAVGNTATLSWTPSAGATGYSWIVYQSSTNGYFGTSFATGSTNSTTYSATVSGLNLASYYYFTVIATGTPNSAAAVSAIMYELPDAPTPTCTTSGITVNMSWTAITGALYYTYTVYQASAYAYSGIQVFTANNGNSLSATYTGVATNYYYFTVSVTTNAGTSALGTSGIAQAVALVAPTITTFSATGSDQLYTFPANAALTVYMWAAAGGGTNSINGNFAGGAGAYVQGTLVATGAQYTIIVGKGGAVDGAAITTRAYKNGGAALNNDKAYIEGGGGGRSGLQLAGVNLIAVGAGGGAGGNGNGGAGGITSGANGSGPSTNYGLGGTQSAGGAAGTGTYNTASPGTQFGGGNAPTNGVGGGGGDGYYGGGGGVALGADQKGGGGGGGSSLTSNLSSLVTYVSSNGYSAPNTSSPYYQAGIAAGAPYATGGDGLVVISASTNTASPTNPTLVSSGGSATMSWTASAGATGYSWVLYQSATNAYAGSSFATGTTTSATTATTTGLTLGQYYYFTVSATGTSNTSAAVASAIILQLITGPATATLSASATTLSLSWAAVAGASSYTYTIYSGSAYSYTGMAFVTSVSTASTSATYAGTAGTYYYFTATATTSSGTSGPTASGVGHAVSIFYSSAVASVTTLAGSGSGAFADGTGASASFNQAGGVALLSDGNFVVADIFNHRIRIVTPAGVVTTLAGSGNAGYADGTGASASFNRPRKVAVISSSIIAVADYSQGYVRLVTYPGGVVTTLASGFSGCPGVAVDPTTGNLIATDQNFSRVNLVTYPGGSVSLIAGGGSGSPSIDGTGINARFNYPYGVAVSPTGVIVVGDFNQNRVRLISSASSGIVTTLAGQTTAGSADGTGASASFSSPDGVAILPNGNIIVADSGNSLVRMVTSGGVVTTLSGRGGELSNPFGVAVLSNGNIIVADSGSSRIKIIAFTGFSPPTFPTLSITTGTATLGWTAPAGATGYSWILYRSSTNAYNGTSNSTGTTTSAVTTTVSSLSAGFFWYFTVTSTNGSATSQVAVSSIIAY